MGQRDAYFDNAKFILIALVVLGHFFTSYIDTFEIIGALYKTIYSFHMPGFILLAGLFAKGVYAKGYFLKIIKKLLIPYILFQIIYTIYYYFLYQNSTFTIDIFKPQWSLWFLLSMFFWNILILGFAKLPPFVGISISILIAMLVGYVEFPYLSFSRTLVFFPFFLIGYYLDKNHLKRLTKPSVRMISVILMLLLLIVYYINPDFNEQWLFGSKSFDQLGDVTFHAMIKRLIIIAVSLLMVFSFLSFISQNQQVYTKWGTQTLYVYLLQGFIIQYFRISEWENIFDDVVSFIILTIISIIVTLLLSSKVVSAITQPIIELNVTRFNQLIKDIQFRKENQQSAD